MKLSEIVGQIVAMVFTLVTTALLILGGLIVLKLLLNYFETL